MANGSGGNDGGSDTAREPLLPTQRQPASTTSTHQHQHQQQQPCNNSSTTTSNNRNTQPVVDLGSRFGRRLWRLVCIIHAAPALSLVLVSLAETVIVSKIGTISGLFYQGMPVCVLLVVLVL